MASSTNQFFIIDFDSTFIQTESLEELAAVAIKHNAGKEKILKEIGRITNLGMDGSIGFRESLARRIKLLRAHRDHIKQTVSVLKGKITPSILKNKAFFKEYHAQIYIISGGFKPLIEPIVTPFGVSPEHIFANAFTFDKSDNIIGVDGDNLLAQDNGKVRKIRSLNKNYFKGSCSEAFTGQASSLSYGTRLTGTGSKNFQTRTANVYVIGDGYTDYQIKEAGLADKFIAFTENAKRQNVIEKADYVAENFDEFLAYIL